MFVSVFLYEVRDGISVCFLFRFGFYSLVTKEKKTLEITNALIKFVLCENILLLGILIDISGLVRLLICMNRELFKP